MKLGGFVGEAKYEGVLDPFAPYLVLGELLYVGKACTFGLGQYRLEQPLGEFLHEEDAEQRANRPARARS